MTAPFVAGLGSHHGDDRAGWMVLDRLRQLGYPNDRMVQLRHPIDLLDVMEVDQPVVICDACVGTGSIGSVHRLTWPSDNLAYQRTMGSHELSFPEVMQIGSQVGIAPQSLQIWMVQVRDCLPGSEPSAEVIAASVRVADEIWGEFCRA